MVKTKKSSKKRKQIKSGTGSSINHSLWKGIMSEAGEKMGSDLDKRLKAVAEVITIAIEEKNNLKFNKLEEKIKSSENKIKLLEQKIIDISNENEGLTRTLSEFIN